MNQSHQKENDQTQPDAALMKELLQAFDRQFGDAVLFDDEINGGDAVDWIGDFVRPVRAALAGAKAPTQPPFVPVCNECGGRDVMAEAITKWNTTEQRWGVSSVLEGSYCCDECGEVKVTLKPVSEIVAPAEPGAR